LWLNENPLDEAELRSLVETRFPNIEILNSKFTSNASVWASLYATY